MAPRAFYAVAKGRNPGVYSTWPECKEHVNGFTGARYKKFNSESEALAFIKENGGGNSQTAGFSGARIPVASSLPSLSLGKRKRNVHITSTDEGCVSKKCKGLEDFEVVYTDGACSNNGQRNAKAGWGVWWGDDHPDNSCGAVWGEATNNRGELIAVLKALQQAKRRDVTKVCVRTDSQLLINSLDTWLPGWKSKGWKRSNGSAVKNDDLLKELENVRSGMTVKFEYVAGHAGIRGNEKADELAVKGARDS